MAASWRLRAAAQKAAEPIFSLPKAVWHRQGLAATASGKTPMQTLFPLCSMVLRRPADEEEVSSGGGGAVVGFEYEMCIQQVNMSTKETGIRPLPDLLLILTIPDTHAKSQGPRLIHHY